MTAGRDILRLQLSDRVGRIVFPDDLVWRDVDFARVGLQEGPGVEMTRQPLKISAVDRLQSRGADLRRGGDILEAESRPFSCGPQAPGDLRHASTYCNTRTSADARMRSGVSTLNYGR